LGYVAHFAIFSRSHRDAAHVKDMLAILRFAQNPRRRLAGFRVVQLIPGIGQATATRLLSSRRFTFTLI
jgi:superfamily I DNA/RNA helicase